jgi:MYXO-CTERM domain-containing protein
MLFDRVSLLLSIALCAGGASGQINVAVFGDNDTDDWLNANGINATIVSDGQIATPGFLDAFDIFYYTRDGTSFGTSLSNAAIAEVQGFVSRRYVLFNSDFADDTGDDDVGPDPKVQQITLNAVNWVGQTGGGYIGEFSGAFAALQSNDGGYTPLGIIAGNGTQSGFSGPPWDGNINLAINHPVLAGVSFPFNPQSIEFGSNMTGLDPSTVIATWDDGSASIIAGSVPGPGALALVGVAGLAGVRRRR